MGDAAVLKEAIGRSEPDLVLIDPWIGGRHRWDVVSGIKKRDPMTPVLLCLAFDAPVPSDAPFPKHLAELADGVVVKSSSTADLLLHVEQIVGASPK